MNKFNKLLLEGLTVVFVSVIGAVMLVEWFAGCGETYIAADGKRYPNECVFLGK